MSGHTPGPWNDGLYHESRDGGRFRVFVTAPDQPVPIACVPTGVEGYGREEGQANARLIAAAPDFREVAPDAADLLERYAEFIRTSVKCADIEQHPYLPLIERTVELLRAAIAKAAPGAAS